MTNGKRSLGEALQVDELRGQNGYVDRISSGLTTGDILRLMVKRCRVLLIFLGAFFLMVVLLMMPVSLDAALFMGGSILVMFAIIFGLIFIVLLCTVKYTANTLIENNYILLLKDKLVIQSQSDLMTLVLRNEIPLEKISRIEHLPVSFIKERKAKTNICLRLFSGMYLQPVGGLYPIASKKECLMALHLNRPHEIRVSSRNQNGMYQLGDKRDYVKEIIISVDPDSHHRLISQLTK